MASGSSDSGNSNRGNGGNGGAHGMFGGGVAFPFAPASPIVVSGFGAADLDADAAATAAASATLGGRDVFPPGRDLADHFLACCRLGRYLTVAEGSRFVITDDFRQPQGPILPPAAAMASIYSRDFLVAESALLPLARTAETLSGREREKFERLFDLIEMRALAPGVKTSAHVLLERDFRVGDLRALEDDLDDRLSPARARYREFLAVIGQLMQGRITPRAFVQEFVDFTRSVAGMLDFGIYSFCIDRIFGSPRIPVNIKQVLAGEIMKYPPLVRRELITNILTLPGQSQELGSFIRELLGRRLERAQLIEIELLEAVKGSRISMSEIETRLRHETRL